MLTDAQLIERCEQVTEMTKMIASFETVPAGYAGRFAEWLAERRKERADLLDTIRSELKLGEEMITAVDPPRPAKRQTKRRTSPILECENCGKFFVFKKGNANRFCSRSCSSALHPSCGRPAKAYRTLQKRPA